MKTLSVIYNDSLQGVTTFNYTISKAIKQLERDHITEVKILEPLIDGYKSKFIDAGIDEYTNGNNYDYVFINNREGLRWVINNKIEATQYFFFVHSLPDNQELQKQVLPPAAASLPYILNNKLQVVVFSQRAKTYLDGQGHSTILVQNAIDTSRFKEAVAPTTIHKLLVLDLRNNLLYRNKIINVATVLPNIFVRCVNTPIWAIEQEIDNADMVVAYGRSAIEAMAMGKPVIIYGANGGDGLVTTANVDKLAETNFSGWSVRNMPLPEHLAEIDILAQIMAYNKEDAETVSTQIRNEYNTTVLLENLNIIATVET